MRSGARPMSSNRNVAESRALNDRSGAPWTKARDPVPLEALTPAQRQLVLALIEARRASRRVSDDHMKAAASVRMNAAAAEVRGDVATPTG